MTDGGHGIVTPGRTFRERSRIAVRDDELQHALRNLDRRLYTARRVAQSLGADKDVAAAIRRDTLADLDTWLERLEASLVRNGMRVHRASTADDACGVVLEIARAHHVRTVVKSKSMATEEIDLGSALERAGIRSVETDLGEYIVQLAGERPSHMITPAIHKTLAQIRDVLSTEAREPLEIDRDALTTWARGRLRQEFLAADMGVTGVNFAAADTGTLVLVTNEGNGRFCTTLPRVHVAVMPVEKVVARLSDVAVLLPLLTASATEQALSNYVTMITGPRRTGETDGPDELHVIFLDNHRRALLGTPYEDMLACVRCGACLNVCPVYRHVGGHAYDAVYSGPMGKVLTPLLSGDAASYDLPHASTLCGACTEACPVEIPLADLIVRLRAELPSDEAFVPRPGAGPPAVRAHRLPGEGFASAAAGAPLRGRVRSVFWSAWARAWASPSGYRITTAIARQGARALGGDGWSSRRVPVLARWTGSRDFPLPARRPFHMQWKRGRR